MGTMFTIITALILITSFLIAAIIHIKKIQTELKEISEEQSQQNEDIKNLMIAHVQLVNAIQEAAKFIKEEKNVGWKKPMGEA
jgi:hypothetical protein